MKTKQETFDEVVAHFVTMKRPSVESMHGMCAYRGPNGEKCFAGCLIPDTDYDIRMEGARACVPEIAEVLVKNGYEVGFVDALQGCHDNAVYALHKELGERVDWENDSVVARWKELVKGNLKHLAKEHGLVMTLA